MDTSLEAVALAGLLHDIGKFAHRAGESVSRTWDDTTRQEFKYQYALQTWHFIDKYVPKELGVAPLAAYHHKPQNREQRLIRLADQLSVGERASGHEPEDSNRTIHPKQIQSIFCSVTAEGQSTPEKLYLPLKPLTLNGNTIFPGNFEPDENKIWDAYAKMWGDFCQEALRLKDVYSGNDALRVYLESILMLMQRYTWCVPSAYYNSIPDISLYDHCRMTGALAAVLIDSDFSENELDALSASPDQSDINVARLVGGDISGVQDFIYTISSRGATSALRGRSFYLQLLTEAVARYTLRCLELPITNLIYAGGGHFYLLARPNDDKKLQEIQRNVSKILIRHHRGDLYLALASKSLHAPDFFDGKISFSWEKLIGELQHIKQRRYSELGDDLIFLFEPLGHGGNEDHQCQVCGLEHSGTTSDEDSDERKCPTCRSYEEDLGDKLRRASYLVLEELPIPKPTALKEPGEPGKWDDVLWYLGVKAEIKPDLNNLPPAEYQRLILALKDDALKGITPTPNTAFGRRFLVNVAPLVNEKDVQEFANQLDEEIKKGDIKPFDLLQKQSIGIPRLGVLRMDVDNLGKIFSNGLGEKATLSRVAALSFAISLYFEGWVEHLAARRNQENGERLYSIYSGGDDLFFVGSWDEIAELGREIRANLTPYAANHPGIHASAGIALVGGKYPLYQAASDAGVAEHQAKSLRPEKDTISFLGQALPWEQFGTEGCETGGVENVHAMMHLLTEIIAEKGVAHSLLRRLISLYKRYEKAAESRRQRGVDLNRSGHEQALWGPWIWLGYYTLTQMANKAENQEIKELADQLKKDDFKRLPVIGLAARWAELRLR